MIKLILFPLLLFAGCGIAGMYGALHDQVSYSVSPDYFHAFKFKTFHIAPEYHNRLGAAIVGWRASWWMGVFIGLPILSVGLAMPNWKSYVTKSLTAFALVAVTAILIGAGALGHGAWHISEASLLGYDFPPETRDQAAFARVGLLHEFSYLGGFAGIITALLYLVASWIRLAVRRPS